jgi:transposase
MSTLSILPYFPFNRVRIIKQSVSSDSDISQLTAIPDQRFSPKCHVCGSKAQRIHSHEKRSIRDLNIGSTRVWINCSYRKVICASCNRIVVENLEFFEPYIRVTRRLALFIYELCKVLTVKDVAKHFGINWKTVKTIDKYFLEQQYGETDYHDLRILAVDEIAISKGHHYMTVVLDYLSGRVVWVGKGRTKETLIDFFNGMTNEQRQTLEAVAMDMWDPYIHTVKSQVPHVKIVFDLFHVVSSFGKVIDKVRNAEFRKATKQDKDVYIGSKYILLKNKRNIRKKEHREHLKQLLSLNETINTVLILKDKLKHLWYYRSRTWAKKALDEWCLLADTLNHPYVRKFTNMLKRYSYGILNHCDYHIHTSKLEGVNNKIKVIKRKAYGFLDERYFSLKIIQAFSN